MTIRASFRPSKLTSKQTHLRRQAKSGRKRTGILATDEESKRYLDLFDAAPIGYFMLDDLGHILAVNVAGARLLGVKGERLYRRQFANYLAPESRAPYKQLLNGADLEAEPQNHDLQIQRQNGDLGHVRMSCVPRRSLQGEVVFHVMLTDITQEKLTALRLEEHKRYNDTLFNYASCPIFVWDTSLRITMVNPAIERLTGYRAESLVGKSITQLFPIDEESSPLAGATAIVDKQQLDFLAEITTHVVDGDTRYISWRSAPIYTDDQHTILAIITQGLDITQHIQMQLELRAAASAFEAQVGIMLIDTSGTIFRVNGAFHRLTGYSSEEAVGRQLTELFEPDQANDDFLEALWENVRQHHYCQGELRNHRKADGSNPILMATITAVFGEDEQVMHFVGAFIDITREKETVHVLESQHAQLEQQVEQAVAELNQLRQETETLNTALKVMIRLRESDTLEAKSHLLTELQQEVMPFLMRLKHSSRDSRQVRLLTTLDANLQRLVTSYGCTMGISSLYQNLTPKEIQVASMVREGFSTKVIAATLSVSPETISIHRKNIRRKLGLESKGDNLRSHLIVLTG